MNRSFLTNLFSLLLLLLIVPGGSTIKAADKIPVTTSSAEAKEEFLKGRDLFDKLRAQNSIQYFDKAVEIDKDFALAYYYNALASPTPKKFFENIDNAVAHSDKISEGEKLVILAAQAGAYGNPAKQKEYLTKLVELYPKDERAHTLLGTFYFGQQQYNDAVMQLKKANKVAPDYSAPYNMLGYSLKNLGKYNEAEKAFKKYTQLIPDDPNPYDSYGELLMKSGKFEESITQYRKALSIDPNFVASRVGISNDYNYLGKYDEARSELRKLYDMARNEGEKRLALFSMAVSYADQGNNDMAVKQIESEYEIGKQINDAAAISADLNAIGNILFESGKFDEAQSKYEQSLQAIEESNLSDQVKENTRRFALYNESRIALMTGDLATAKAKSKEFGEKAMAANNTFQKWLYHELEGSIALTEKNYDKAEKEFGQSNMQNPYTYYRLALVYKGKNDMKEAKAQCEMAINFNSLNNLNQSFARTKAKEMLSSL
jgi:tetratricopeptide (TPR) repeat protein